MTVPADDAECTLKVKVMEKRVESTYLENLIEHTTNALPKRG